MDVILLENIGNLGGLGDRVAVKAGYGRNYLIPQGKAVPATPANVAEFEARRAQFERAATEVLTAAQARAQDLAALEVITVEANAGEEGKLFGSVGARDIAAAVTAAGCPLDKSEIRLPAGALRETGEYRIAVQLHPEVSSDLTLAIVPE